MLSINVNVWKKSGLLNSVFLLALRSFIIWCAIMKVRRIIVFFTENERKGRRTCLLATRKLRALTFLAVEIIPNLGKFISAEGLRYLSHCGLWTLGGGSNQMKRKCKWRRILHFVYPGLSWIFHLLVWKVDAKNLWLVYCGAIIMDGGDTGRARLVGGNCNVQFVPPPNWATGNRRVCLDFRRGAVVNWQLATGNNSW